MPSIICSLITRLTNILSDDIKPCQHKGCWVRTQSRSTDLRRGQKRNYYAHFLYYQHCTHVMDPKLSSCSADLQCCCRAVDGNRDGQVTPFSERQHMHLPAHHASTLQQPRQLLHVLLLLLLPLLCCIQQSRLCCCNNTLLLLLLWLCLSTLLQRRMHLGDGALVWCACSQPCTLSALGLHLLQHWLQAQHTGTQDNHGTVSHKTPSHCKPHDSISSCHAADMINAACWSRTMWQRRQGIMQCLYLL